MNPHHIWINVGRSLSHEVQGALPDICSEFGRKGCKIILLAEDKYVRNALQLPPCAGVQCLMYDLMPQDPDKPDNKVAASLPFGF